jgi:hypothetical protein
MKNKDRVCVQEDGVGVGGGEGGESDAGGHIDLPQSVMWHHDERIPGMEQENLLLSNY